MIECPSNRNETNENHEGDDIDNVIGKDNGFRQAVVLSPVVHIGEEGSLNSKHNENDHEVGGVLESCHERNNDW